MRKHTPSKNVSSILLGMGIMAVIAVVIGVVYAVDAFNAGGNPITNLPLTPANPSDAASKSYVDGAGGKPGSWTCMTRKATCSTSFSNCEAKVTCAGTEKLIFASCMVNSRFNTHSGELYLGHVTTDTTEQSATCSINRIQGQTGSIGGYVYANCCA
jgi:hypothetical protein